MNFTEAGITLMTVKEVWGCVLAAGVPQDGTWQLSYLCVAKLRKKITNLPKHLKIVFEGLKAKARFKRE